MNIPTCHQGYHGIDNEYDYWIQASDIEGEIPSDLFGSFFRNGPGRMEVGGQKFGHWFDGDGMICRFSFKDGKVHFKNKFVRTPKYISETKAGKIVKRGFGTQKPGGILANFLRPPANPANTNTVLINDTTLLALYEGGKPFALNVDDLSTQGEHDFDKKLGAMHMFSAHGRWHKERGEFINFAAGINKKFKPCLYLYRINEHGKITQISELPLGSMPFAHDFVITQDYAVVMLNSATMDNLGKSILGFSTMADGLIYHPDVPVRIMVFNLNDFSVQCERETEPGNLVHFGNAWQENNQIVLDAMYIDNFDANEQLKDVFSSPHAGGGEYRRYRISLTDDIVKFEKLSPYLSEFPIYNRNFTAKKSQIGYSAVSYDNGADSFFNAIQRLEVGADSQLLVLPEGTFGSEPCFVSTSENEAEGYLLEIVYNAHNHCSELHIINAQVLTDTKAVIRLKHHIPHQFHGLFVEKLFI